jgi:hypothetical protein
MPPNGPSARMLLMNLFHLNFQWWYNTKSIGGIMLYRVAGYYCTQWWNECLQQWRSLSFVKPFLGDPKTSC